MDVRIQRTIQLLQRNPSIKVQELAQCCRISPSRLSHLFKQETGSSVDDYRRNRRLQQAARMLLSTDMSVKEIAYELGYRHTSSFVRAFKAELESSPADYRDHHAEHAA